MSSHMSSYSSNNATQGIRRGLIVETRPDGKDRVFIPNLHRGRNPFNANITTTVDENGNSRYKYEYTTESAEASENDAPAENEEQNSSNSPINDNTDSGKSDKSSRPAVSTDLSTSEVD